MNAADHKAVRRAILEFLYENYLEDPLRMVEPEPILARSPINGENVIPNMHYLFDRKLVEMMMGYTPPMFSAVRITPAGIDLVEDRYNFDRQFPPCCEATGESKTTIPHLVELLVAQGDLTPLDGWTRRQLQRDIQYLRDELAQPQAQWRTEVLETQLAWIEERHQESGNGLPALAELRSAIASTVRADG